MFKHFSDLYTERYGAELLIENEKGDKVHNIQVMINATMIVPAIIFPEFLYRNTNT